MWAHHNIDVAVSWEDSSGDVPEEDIWSKLVPSFSQGSLPSLEGVALDGRGLVVQDQEFLIKNQDRRSLGTDPSWASNHTMVLDS